MNYLKTYYSLIEKRKKDILVENYHKHHIIPKCCGGTNDNENLVRLSYREHYIAHILLAKAYPSNYSLQCAVHRLKHSKFLENGIYNSRVYESIIKNRNLLCSEYSSKFMKNKTVYRNIITNKCKLLSIDDDCVKSGLYVGVNKGISIQNRGNKGYITAIDKNSNIIRVKKEDFYSKGYKGINSGKQGLWDIYNKKYSELIWYEKLMFTTYKKTKVKTNSKILFLNIFELYDYVKKYFNENRARISFDYKDMKEKLPYLFYKKVDKPLGKVLFEMRNGWNPNCDETFLISLSNFKKILEEQHESI